MSTLQERLRREAEFMLDRGIVTRGQRLVSAGEMREAADALDAAEAKLAAIDALSEEYLQHEVSRFISMEFYRILHPQGGNRRVTDWKLAQ